MTLSENLIVILVLFGLFILAYCKLANKTLLDVWRELISAIKGE